jgi:broad specificity phosphatase PhoE
MPTLRFISHPEVAIDAQIAVPQWGLSDIGRARAHALADEPWAASLSRLLSSGETKAVETAEILGNATGLAVEQRTALGENDRSATGFLNPTEFEATADSFFAQPEVSVRGWERAVDAQARVVAAIDDLWSNAGDVAIVAHGGVGTLLLCHLLGVGIDRRHDQPGQGHYFSVDLASREVLHRWRRFA